MKILDWLGRVWNPATVGKGQLQTDNAVGAMLIKQAFVQHPMRGMTPAMLSTIMDQAERGQLLLQHEFFLDMEERDPHLHAEISKRKRTVIGLPRQVMPPPKANKADLKTAAILNNIIDNIPNFDTVLLDLLDAIGHGFSCGEITWEYSNGMWVPARITHRPQYWFQLDIPTRTEIRLRNMSVNGDELWPFGWIVHKHGAKTSEIARSGLYRVLAWPWLMKQYSLRDLAEYLEIYGLPVKIGKYPRSAPEDDRDNLYTALQQLGRNVSGIMPDDMHIEFLKESLGSATPFLNMVEYCDAVMSMAIIGQTLSGKASNTGLGSGVAMLQGSVRQDLLESDAEQLSSTITQQLIHPLLTLNGWDTGKAFTYFFDTSTTEDLTIFSGAIQNLVNAGVKIPVDWIYSKAGIPPPEEDDVTIGGEQTMPVPFGASLPSLPPPVAPPSNDGGLGTTATSPEAKAKATAKAVADAETKASAALSSPKNLAKPKRLSMYVDANVHQLEQNMSPIMDAVLKRVKALLDESKTMTEFQGKLKQFVPEAEKLDLTEVLASAFYAAELAGRYDVAKRR